MKVMIPPSEEAVLNGVVDMIAGGKELPKYHYHT